LLEFSLIDDHKSLPLGNYRLILLYIALPNDRLK
jgi:hypothetical protein